ncbi:MAG TPA: alpha/beta hydrolase [Acidimicrobiales bacterium]
MDVPGPDIPAGHPDIPAGHPDIPAGHADIPAGHAVTLPGRGTTWVYDTGPLAPSAGRVGRRPLVLLHGWTSTAALNWFRCFRALRQEFRVIALDQRGHGRGIRSRRPFRLEDCADDVAALTEQLGTGPVTAVGYSMGGPVAELLWQRHRDVVDSLVLCATAPKFASRADMSGPVGALGYGMALALSGVPAGLRRQGFSLLLRNWTADRGWAAWAIEESQRNDPAALVQAGLSLGRFDATSWIASIDVPTAVVVTTLDNTVPPSRQWELTQAIPGARAFPVAGDHRACAEQARLFVPAVLAACRAVQTAPLDHRATAAT